MITCITGREWHETMGPTGGTREKRAIEKKQGQKWVTVRKRLRNLLSTPVGGLEIVHRYKKVKN